MSAFRTETVYGLRTLKVFHTNHLPRPVACICFRDDGGVDLVPVLYDAPPKPLTGREQPFDSLEMALAYLGIPTDVQEAA